jgi:hypothetical protein
MMKNRIEAFFYKPYLEDLWFRQSMMADPETMEYNRVWGGTIPFPCEKWAEWYNNWVQNPNKRFYRYIATGKSRSFVGEAAYHYDPDEGIIWQMLLSPPSVGDKALARPVFRCYANTPKTKKYRNCMTILP